MCVCGHDHTDGCPWCDCPEPARGFPWPWVAGLALLLILLLNLL